MHNDSGSGTCYDVNDRGGGYSLGAKSVVITFDAKPQS